MSREQKIRGSAPPSVGIEQRKETGPDRKIGRFAAAPMARQDNETRTGKSRAEHDETNPRCYASLAIVAAVARLSLVMFTLVADMVRSVNVHAGRGSL